MHGGRALAGLAVVATLACRDRPKPTAAPAAVRDAAMAPTVDARAALDLGFVRGLVVVGEDRDGWQRPLQLDPATGAWIVLGGGAAHLFPTGQRLDGGLLCIATVGDTEADHVEQLAVVRGVAVARLGPTAQMIRNPTVGPDVVVIESNHASYRDLYAVGPRGVVRRLTDDAAGNFEPALAPDGAQVAFASSRDGNAELYVQPLAGGPARRLTSASGDDWSPTWAPDGARLAFLSDRDGAARVYTIPAAGGDPRRLSSEPGTDASEDAPRWSPDGTQLAFVRTAAGRATVVIGTVATRAVRTITPDGAADSAAAWSPDGAALAVLRTRGGVGEVTFVRATDGAVRGAVRSTTTYVRWLAP
ncbi:MAG: PD40 domain-containing protein [Myxococcales bacterium]|nr:PD40 domain-containing protein [Myxococcales bacterium]